MMNDFENELDQIRVDLYEKSKDLSPDEFVKQMNDRASRVASQYGFSIVSSADGANRTKKIAL